MPNKNLQSHVNNYKINEKISENEIESDSDTVNLSENDIDLLKKQLSSLQDENNKLLSS